MIANVDELLAGPLPDVRVGIGRGSSRGCVERSAEAFEGVRIYDDAESLVADLMSGEIDVAVRGDLTSESMIPAVRAGMGLDRLERAVLLQPADGRMFMLAPVGIDEGWDDAQKVDIAERASDLACRIGMDPRIAVMSGGRDDDRGRCPEVDRTIDSSTNVVDALVRDGYDAYGCQILIEDAVRNAGEKARRDPTNVSAAAVIRPERTDKPAEPPAAKPAPESPAEDKHSDGETIQQSIFARQQFQAIARARGEGAEDLIKEENAKRKRAPVRERPDKNAKTEDKPKENGARVSQVHIDQEIAKATSHKPYVAPPMSLLAPPEGEVSQQEDYEFKKQQLCDTLAFFDIQSEVTDIRVGPTFSLYTLKVEMPRGSRISSINNLDDDIAMRMEESSVRIIAPIPGKNAVGIEVPNKYRRIVRLSEIVGSPEFNSAPSPSTFALGVDLYGKKFACDVASLPHMLIAGATGAGKSCCINSLIISLLYKASPDDVRMILIDPKRVELSVYAGIPHLMLDEIVCDVDKAIRALNWAIQEMERRIAYLSSIKYSNIEDYNRDCEKLGYPKMPRIVIIVDELADLMAQGKKAVEDAINRLARLARAMGIHLILATQRPSVDVVSGTIKNNLPTRVAFRVTSGPDSRTVLDAGGAEKLLGNGDLLYMHPKNSDFVRMQGAFITPQEIKSVVEFVIANNESVYDSSVKDAIFKDPAETAEHKIEKGSAHKAPGVPPEVFAAARIGLDGTPLTISSLQRKLNLGFPKAARVVDIMKDLGIVEYNTDDKKYHVVISEEELDALENGDKTDPEDGGEES